MSIIPAILVTFIATVGFAMYFHLRDYKLLFAAGLSGAIGYAIFRWTGTLLVGDAFPTFFGAMSVGFMGELFSRWFRAPAPVMILPGIVPLVPGARLYEMMLYFVQEDFWPALEQGIQVAFIAGGIALGILASSLFSLSVRRMRRVNIRGKERKA